MSERRAVRHRVPALVIALALAFALLPGAPAGALPAPPAAITALSDGPGPRPGEITFRWTSTGAGTDFFELETALTSFSRTDPTMPPYGRAPRSFTVPATARSVTLSASEVASTGAGLGSGQHLYYLLTAVHLDGLSTQTTTFPRAQTAMPRGLPAAQSKGTEIRAATFNVRTAKATADPRPWLKRASAVAREIVRNDLDVVALQELSPGRADGRKGSTKKVGRQTTTLLTALARNGGKRYALVRSTPYVKKGRPSGSQGTRLLYDSGRFRLLTTCRQTTGGKVYSDSCTIKLPLLAGDSEKLRRRAAYAELKDRRSGRRFWVVSAHFDQRHSKALSAEVAYNGLRGLQATAVSAALDRLNPKRRTVVFGADLNSWQVSKVGDAPHEALVRAGFFDTASAGTAVNLGYPTSNQFKTVVPRNPWGYGTRIDAVMVTGTRGANRWENVLKGTDAARPSDHNLIYADLVL